MVEPRFPAHGRDWASALSALPLEAPPRSAWPECSARLGARARRRWPALLAMAAALALVAIVPLRHGFRDAAPTTSAARSAQSPAPGPTDGFAEPRVAGTPDRRPTGTDAARMAGNGGTGDQSPARAGARLAVSAPPHAPVQPASDAVDLAPVTPPPTSAQAIAAQASLEHLYAESAQLEAVLLLASDGRMASGPAAALADELDDHLAGIDAALAHPGLPSQQRVALWEQRVQALRQVAGFQATQRWLAASGERYDGALVGID